DPFLAADVGGSEDLEQRVGEGCPLTPNPSPPRGEGRRVALFSPRGIRVQGQRFSDLWERNVHCPPLSPRWRGVGGEGLPPCPPHDVRPAVVQKTHIEIADRLLLVQKSQSPACFKAAERGRFHILPTTECLQLLPVFRRHCEHHALLRLADPDLRV